MLAQVALHGGYIYYYSPDLKHANLNAMRGHRWFTFYPVDLRHHPLDLILDGVDVIFHLAAMPGLPKSWTEFAGPDAPKLDFVFTVCDDAAKEACPVWPGQPMTAHWGVPDPAAATGNEAEIRFAFADALRMLTNRINIFVSLPTRSLDQLALP